MSEHILPQSSQYVNPLWIDPGIKSEISERELISTLKKEKEKKVKKIIKKSTGVE